ncbi:MAG TPA: ABC transporter permease [bacterium]|nr:ABC transporter permease [bacterium]
MAAPFRTRLRRHPPIITGGALVLLIGGMAVAAPLLAPHDPNQTHLILRLRPPGADGFPLGSDGFGRDVLSRLLYGARISLAVGVWAVGIGGAAGVLLGLVGGYAGGWADVVLGRIVDVIMAFPAILLALAIVAALGPSLPNSVVAIAVTMIPRFSRVIRGVVLAIRGLEFVQAAQALGSTPARIAVRHVLPNVLSPVIVLTSLGVGTAILVEASLSFLGLGVPPPTATWGSMITDGKEYMDIAPWVSGFSGAFIMAAVLGFNLLGDGLRDLLDPRLKT